MDASLISTVLLLALFVALITANGLFVAAEFSLVTVDRPAVDAAVHAGDRRSKSVSRALKSLSFQLSGAQLGITLTALLTGFLATPALAPLFSPFLGPFGAAATGIAVTIAMIVANILSMLFGELVPKNAALARPFTVARAVAWPHRAFSRGFAWLITILNGSANWIIRRMGIEPQEELATARSPAELRLLAAMSARAGMLSRDTAVLLQRTLRFGDRRAAEAMTPRVDLTALPAQASVQDLIRASIDTGISRFPVYEGTTDQIMGVAQLTDVLGVSPAQRASTPLRTVAREPVFVSEHLDLNTLATRLTESRADLAVVIDEYGGTDGIVTVEDLAEELVGEIADEHDLEHPDAEPGTYMEATGATTHLLLGDLHADEVAEQTGFRMPEGPYETLAGFLMAQLGHIPAYGETVDYEGWEFTVTDLERLRVAQIRVQPPHGWTPAGDFLPHEDGPAAGDAP